MLTFWPQQQARKIVLFQSRSGARRRRQSALLEASLKGICNSADFSDFYAPQEKRGQLAPFPDFAHAASPL
jgi:hypothetical protein